MRNQSSRASARRYLSYLSLMSVALCATAEESCSIAAKTAARESYSMLHTPYIARTRSACAVRCQQGLAGTACNRVYHQANPELSGAVPGAELQLVQVFFR